MSAAARLRRSRKQNALPRLNRAAVTLLFLAIMAAGLISGRALERALYPGPRSPIESVGTRPHLLPAPVTIYTPTPSATGR